MNTRTNPLTALTVKTTRAIPMDIQALAVVRGYNKGTSIARLASKFGFGQNAVRTLLVTNGVAIRPRGRYKSTAGA